MFVDIVYEWLPLFCHHCKVIGHDARDCKRGRSHVGHEKLRKQPIKYVKTRNLNKSQEPPLEEENENVLL